MRDWRQTFAGASIHWPSIRKKAVKSVVSVKNTLTTQMPNTKKQASLNDENIRFNLASLRREGIYPMYIFVNSRVYLEDVYNVFMRYSPLSDHELYGIKIIEMDSIPKDRFYFFPNRKMKRNIYEYFDKYNRYYV